MLIISLITGPLQITKIKKQILIQLIIRKKSYYSFIYNKKLTDYILKILIILFNELTFKI